MKWFLGPIVAFLIGFIPSLAYADDGVNEDVLLRIGADVHIPRDERAGTVIVIDGNALIEGEVTGTVLVIDGNITIVGEVGGDITAISGDIDLRPTAQVKSVTSIHGDIIRAETALVTGDIHERDGFGGLGAAVVVFSILFWLGLTVGLVGAGLLFAAIGGRQLHEASLRATAEPVNTILGAVFIAVAIPLLAALAMVTLIGIPFGIGLLLFVLPAFWFLGYIVVGARLGMVLTGLRRATATDHPYAATAVGIILLQLLVLVPVIGVLLALVAGLWGAGALTFTAYRAAGGRGVEANEGSITSHHETTD